MSSGGVGSIGSMPGVFYLVTHWCVCGSKRIFVGAVGVDDVWVVFFGVGVTLSPVVLNIFANFCKASPWRPWKVLLSCLIFCIERVSVVAIPLLSIGASVGIEQCLE